MSSGGTFAKLRTGLVAQRVYYKGENPLLRHGDGHICAYNVILTSCPSSQQRGLYVCNRACHCLGTGLQLPVVSLSSVCGRSVTVACKVHRSDRPSQLQVHGKANAYGAPQLTIGPTTNGTYSQQWCLLACLHITVRYSELLLCTRLLELKLVRLNSDRTCTHWMIKYPLRCFRVVPVVTVFRCKNATVRSPVHRLQIVLCTISPSWKPSMHSPFT